MLLPLFVSCWLLVASGSLPKNQIDINNASLAEIRKLPVSPKVQEKIWEYLKTYGRFNSIYDLRKIRELSPEDFEKIKYLLYIAPAKPTSRLGLRYIHRVQKSLAQEESPTQQVVEEWQDLLLTPMNINKVTVDDLLVLENVSLQDAIAVVEHQKRTEIKSLRDLRQDVIGLSDYGYRNLRNFVTFTDPPPIKFSGNFRLNYEFPNRNQYFLLDDQFAETKLQELNQAFAQLEEPEKFAKVGLQSPELLYYEKSLTKEKTYLEDFPNPALFRSRLKLRFGNNLRFGFSQTGITGRARVELQNLKGFINLGGISPFKKLIIGDYRVTLGQGILLDNSYELTRRRTSVIQGIYPDLTPQDYLTFRGIGGESEFGRIRGLAFYSQNLRDGIINPDNSINYYTISPIRFPTNYKNFQEINYGGSLKLDLSKIGFFSYGSYLGFNGLACRYSKSFSPEPKFLDLPGDNHYLDDPNYTQLASGRERLFYGIDFRTGINNLAVEAEYSRQRAGGAALLLKTRTQYNYLYLLTIFRHYDVNYDNPYNRGFSEDRKFENTILERTYRLIDPTYAYLSYFPQPRAEQGVYTEFRYQISRAITFTRVYLDIWQDLGYSLTNYRFQGEVEYRPIFPLRVRLRQKLQERNNPKDVLPTSSKTLETGIRFLVTLSENNFLNAEIRRGKVLLTPSEKFGGNNSLWGGFFSVGWEHNLSEDLGFETQVAFFNTRGMSQWILEDVGIDFLEGSGMKWFGVVSDRISDYLLLRLKFLKKIAEFPHTGILTQEAAEIYFRDGTKIVEDFTVQRNLNYISLQLDFLW